MILGGVAAVSTETEATKHLSAGYNHTLSCAFLEELVIIIGPVFGGQIDADLQKRGVRHKV